MTYPGYDGGRPRDGRPLPPRGSAFTMTGQPPRPEQDPASTPPFRLGDWLVRPQLNRLSRGERVVQLGPRIMHILVVLAARAGQVVRRETLMEIVWHDAVVSEETLTVAVSDLRRSLEDDPQRPRYVETIRKVGYRIIAPVAAAGADRPAQPMRRRQRSWVRSMRGLGLALAGAGVLAAGLGILRPWDRESVPEMPAALRSVPLTSYPSSEITPALSHDGTRVAFAWAGEEMDDLDIYVKLINTDPPMRLTYDPAGERFPAWSPNNDRLAFARGGSSPGIYVVPSIGGVARRLITTSGPVIGIDWSPDGRTLLYAARSAASGRHALFRLDLATGEATELAVPTESTHPPAGGAFYPAWSPDGLSIAFVRSDPCRLQDIWLMPSGGGTARRLTHAQRLVDGLDWTADGRGVVFASSPTGDH